ncbi:MAG: YidB family protein, partial [Candidatus Sulfotelmatobacter sp.]
SNPEAAAVLQMIQSHPGGISGMVQAFHSNGLGGVINSWISTGQNQPISASQIEQVLGCGPVQALAQKLGISTDQASSTLSQLLPSVVDKLSPNGAVPDQSNLLQMGESLLASFGKTGTNS